MAEDMADHEKIIAKDLPEVVNTMREMGEKVLDVDQHVEKLMQKITSGALVTKKGVSFIEVKFHLLLSYVIDLTYYLLTKAEGKSWQGDPAVERLIEARTVLEKMRPIDQKMKYQIDKMIKSATTGIVGAENDPLRFKPNPNNMVTKLDDKESESSDDDGQKKTKVYVPPKVAAVPFDEDGDKKTRIEREKERSRKRALASSMLQDLRDEYSEAPQEIQEQTVTRRRKQKEREEEEEQTRYEEENLIRLPAKKKKKMWERAESGFHELTSFADLSVLNAGEEKAGVDHSAESRLSTSKKSKVKVKRKFGSAKKKKGFARRRRR
ncbi:neuroguidin-like [Montipora capricornis]|uniref:neuroguidin-like n=1 Tax=Montipora capricornis TaxID=246305 RepID=UPI0035F1E00E